MIRTEVENPFVASSKHTSELPRVLQFPTAEAFQECNDTHDEDYIRRKDAGGHADISSLPETATFASPELVDLPSSSAIDDSELTQAGGDEGYPLTFVTERDEAMEKAVLPDKLLEKEICLVFPTYGYRRSNLASDAILDSSINPVPWDTFVHGWLYSPKVASKTRKMTINLMSRYLGLKNDRRERDVFEERLQMFFLNNLPGRRVIARIHEQRQRKLSPHIYNFVADQTPSSAGDASFSPVIFRRSSCCSGNRYVPDPVHNSLISTTSFPEIDCSMQSYTQPSFTAKKLSSFFRHRRLHSVSYSVDSETMYENSHLQLQQRASLESANYTGTHQNRANTDGSSDNANTKKRFSLFRRTKKYVSASIATDILSTSSIPHPPLPTQSSSSPPSLFPKKIENITSDRSNSRSSIGSDISSVSLDSEYLYDMRSDESGHFLGRATLDRMTPHESMKSTHHIQVSDQERQKIDQRELVVLDICSFEYEQLKWHHHPSGICYLIPPVGIAIVSDIDDTIKHSQVKKGLKKLLTATLVHGSVAVDGMSTLYQRWCTPLPNSIHYVSNAPWQLYPMIAEFLRTHHFPEGSIHMKQLSPTPNASTSKSLWQHARGSHAFINKLTQILGIMKDFPWRRFVLVGDSGEFDAAVYAQVAEMHPFQVKGIYIRDITTPALKKRQLNIVEKFLLKHGKILLEKGYSREQIQEYLYNTDALTDEGKSVRQALAYYDDQIHNFQKRMAGIFKNVHPHVWKLFEQPEELKGICM